MRPNSTRSDRRLRPGVLGLLFVGALTLITSCGGGDDAYTTGAGAQTRDVDLSGTDVEMHHGVGCGCCHEWATYIRGHGATVVEIPEPALDQLRDELGVPPEAASCHVAFIEGYVVVGHVPAEAITAVLATRPIAVGITVPGMPADSPGMGGDASTWAALDVFLIGFDGRLTPFEF